MKSILKSKVSLFTRVGLTGVLVLVLVLSACSPNTTETAVPATTESPATDAVRTPDDTATPRPSPTPTDPPAINLEADDLAGIALRFMHPWTGDAAAALDEIATQFSLTNPWDIWVDVEPHGGETALLEALRLDEDQDDLPAMIAVHPYMLTVLNGAYETVPLDMYLNDPGWGLEPDDLDDIPDVFFEPFYSEQTLTALPVAPQATLLFYNQTWAESLGFDALPEDEADFRQQTCEAAFANRDDESPENDGTGGWIVTLDPPVLAGWHGAFGGQLPVSGLPAFNTGPGRDSFAYLKAGFDQGCFWVGRKEDPYFYFANRYALSYAGTLDEIPDQVGWMQVAGSEDRWTVMAFPGPDGPQVPINGPGVMIGADSPENQLAAWLFAKHLLTPEVQARLASTLFSLPVRRSALPLLEDFAKDYPQWEAGAALVDGAFTLPASEDWGLAQWIWQDAAVRLLQAGDISPDEVLVELDRMIQDLEGAAP